MLAKKALAAALSAKKVYVEDVFSTYLYKGNGSSQTITNNIDLSGEGGLVWIKCRTNSLGATNHMLFDTARGVANYLRSNLTNSEASAVGDGLSAFNSNGFTLPSAWAPLNYSSDNYASWTFRKAKKFFDVVTYTGNASSRTISHNLGSVPGTIIVKCTSEANDWVVYHRSFATPASSYLKLNTTDTVITGNTYIWDNTAPTSSVFSVGASGFTNNSGQTYVAYLFAHDAGGFGDAGSDSIIKCGSYTGNGSSTGPSIDLGWEPQWLLVKNASAAQDWVLHDTMRGFTARGGRDAQLIANSSAAEYGDFDQLIDLTSTGFELRSTNSIYNANGNTYIYIAIRRGPMKTPTSGTSVFSPDIGANVTSGSPLAYEAGFPVDLIIDSTRTSPESTFIDRLRGGNQFIQATNTNAESGGALRLFDNMTGVKFNGTNNFSGDIGWQFRRAPGFFDVVCYTGTGSNRTVSHNLGVAPELMIIKNRNAVTHWPVYYGNSGTYMHLSLNDAASTSGSFWNSTSPTSSVFTVGTSNQVNGSTNGMVAYLFASLSGVSKVGSYTGNGSNQTINCGFTNGARFVLIKRTDSTGDWYVYDSARGIVSGNDPQLKLNSTAAEATGYDAIDPDNSGFIVNNDATNFPINVNNATYIYLAIA